MSAREHAWSIERSKLDTVAGLAQSKAVKCEETGLTGSGCMRIVSDCHLRKSLPTHRTSKRSAALLTVSVREQVQVRADFSADVLLRGVSETFGHANTADQLHLIVPKVLLFLDQSARLHRL